MYVTCNAQITDLTSDERFRLFAFALATNKLRNQHKKIFAIIHDASNQNCLERNARDVVCDFARFLSFTNYTGIVCLEKQGNQNNAQIC